MNRIKWFMRCLFFVAKKPVSAWPLTAQTGQWRLWLTLKEQSVEIKHLSVKTYPKATFLTFENEPKAEIAGPHSRWLRGHANYKLCTWIWYLCENKKVSENVFAYLPGAQIEWFKRKKGRKSRDNVSLTQSDQVSSPTIQLWQFMSSVNPHIAMHIVSETCSSNKNTPVCSDSGPGFKSGIVAALWPVVLIV